MLSGTEGHGRSDTNSKTAPTELYFPEEAVGPAVCQWNADIIPRQEDETTKTGQ